AICAETSPITLSDSKAFAVIGVCVTKEACLSEVKEPSPMQEPAKVEEKPWVWSEKPKYI
mgnify:CR=1